MVLIWLCISLKHVRKGRLLAPAANAHTTLMRAQCTAPEMMSILLGTCVPC